MLSNDLNTQIFGTKSEAVAGSDETENEIQWYL